MNTDFIRKYLNIINESDKKQRMQEWSSTQSGSWTDADFRSYSGNDPRAIELRDLYLKKYPTPPDPEIYPELYGKPPEADPPRRSGSWTDADFRSYSGNDPRAIELRDAYLKKHPTPPDPKLYPELYGEPPPGYRAPPRSPIEGKWQPPPSPIETGRPNAIIPGSEPPPGWREPPRSPIEGKWQPPPSPIQGGQPSVIISNVTPSSGSTSSNVAPSSGSTSSNVAKSGGSRTSSKADNTANTPREPYAAPVDFNTRSATRDIADTGLGKLSGGVSLGGGAGNYLSPQLRAELANQSGGKFYGDVGPSGGQFGYEQKFGDKARGQLAVRQTPGGGQSVGIGGSYDVTPNLKLTGGVSRDIKGQGGDRADIGLRYDFKESFNKRMNLLAKSLIEEI